MIMLILIAVLLFWGVALVGQLFSLAFTLLLLPFRILAWMFVHPKSFLCLFVLVLLFKFIA